MKGRENWTKLLNRITLLGNSVLRRSYNPKIQKKILHLERFRALLDKTDDGIIEAEAASGIIIEANQAAANVLSTSKENLIGNSIYDFFDSDVCDKVKNLQRTLSERESGALTTETLINLPGQAYRIIELSVQISFFDNWSYLVIIASDITERIKSQEQIRVSELNLRSIFDSTYDAILIHDELGQIMEVNAATLRIFEFTREYATQVGVSALSATADQLKLLPDYWKKTLEGEPVVFEWKAIRPLTRSTFFAEFALKKVIWNGEAAIVAVIRDITERKRLEKELLNSVINTEERERLNFSQELHDGLGPLLSAAKIYVQWLERPDTKADKNTTIRDIDKLLDEAIHSIREISFKLSPHILQNYGLIEALEAFLSKIKKYYNITIELLAEEIPRINELVETIIYRILCECVNNTLKHAGAEGIRIFIEKTDNAMFVFYSDDGRGFNVEEKLKDKQGVGLLNMRNRLNSINGKINFQSSPGHGTNIYIKVIIPEPLNENT